jgi:hypothetical protein
MIVRSQNIWIWFKNDENGRAMSMAMAVVGELLQ